MTETLSDNNIITVIIPVCNAGRVFAELLDSLRNQTLKPSQIIVVDSESTDQTPQFARDQNCKIIPIKRADFDHGTTRNLAASEVSTEFMVFLTQDAIPADKHMIAELIKPMQTDSNIVICYGRQLPRPKASPLERFAREYNYPAESILKTKNDLETLGLKTYFCSNSCSAVRYSVFRDLGGFKNGVIVNEDMLFAAKAICNNYSVYYAAEAQVYHSHPHSLPQTFKRYINIGRFFADNTWLLEQTGLNQYGGEMMKAGIKAFRKKRKLHYLAVLFAEFVIKTVAFRSGWYYQKLFCTKRDTQS